MTNPITRLHNAVFGGIQVGLQNWFPGLLARLTFASVLLLYFLNSAKTKVGDGLAGFFQVQDNAYFQILPKVVEQFNYDASQIPAFPYQWIVYAGTYSEFILPVLIVAGLFTRIAAVGMIIFVFVQTYVDITAHGADEKTIGSFFDRLPDAAIADQRALWVFLLVYLFIYGAGKVSLDHLFGGRNHGS
jgi:putative oxidoreductase